MRKLGMAWGAKPKTDDEYIASLRERLKDPRRSVVANACGVALLFLLFLFCLSVGFLAAALIAARPGQYGPCFAVSMFLGMPGGFVLWGACSLLWETPSRLAGRCRTEHLLLRFFDDRKSRMPPESKADPPCGERPEASGRRLLGMRLVRARRTDDQYIEFTRKGLGRLKWFRRFGVAIAVLNALLFVGLLALWTWLAGVFSADSDLPPFISFDGGWQGLVTGMAWGTITAAMSFWAGEPLERLVRALYGYRTERLLLKYYDESHGEQGNGGAAASQGS